MMEETSLAKISLHQALTLKFWSFDLHDAPKDFQKDFNTSFCLGAIALRTQGEFRTTFLPEAYLLFRFYEINGQIALDIEQKPILKTEEPLQNWLKEIKSPSYPVIMELGPKWYLVSFQEKEDENGYDYDLVVRLQYEDEEIVPYGEHRDYLIITSEGEIV